MTDTNRQIDSGEYSIVAFYTENTVRSGANILSKKYYVFFLMDL